MASAHQNSIGHNEQNSLLKKHQNEVESLKSTIEELKNQIQQMKELIVEVCESAFGSSIQKNAVINKLETIKNGKMTKDKTTTRNNIQQEREEEETNKTPNIEKENEGKGKRKQPNESRLSWCESDMSGIPTQYQGCCAKAKNRQLNQQL